MCPRRKEAIVYKTCVVEPHSGNPGLCPKSMDMGTRAYIHITKMIHSFSLSLSNNEHTAFSN